MRTSVCVGGADSPWQLPASVPDDRISVGGGERTMYELSFALAELGHDVELRGRVSRSVFAELAAVTRAAPSIDAAARRPEADEVVLMLEGFVDPLVFGAVAMSPARAVLLLLAPAGLMGWDFQPGWSLPEPLSVDVAAVNQPRSYQAMHELGFELWTHSHGIHAAVAAAGVPCAWVGQGSPGPPPALVAKAHDVAIVGGNRWEPLARQVLDGLPVTPLVTPTGTNAQVLAALGSARLVVHPMRVEGTSRLGIEARAVGTVPVVLDHAFGAGFTTEEGAVVVPTLAQLREAVTDLLGDPDRVQGLAAQGLDFARRWRDWPSYLSRLDQALRHEELRPGRGARASVGAAVEDLVRGAREEQRTLRSSYEEITAHARALERDREALRGHIAELQRQLGQG